MATVDSIKVFKEGAPSYKFEQAKTYKLKFSIFGKKAPCYSNLLKRIVAI